MAKKQKAAVKLPPIEMDDLTSAKLPDYSKVEGSKFLVKLDAPKTTMDLVLYKLERDESLMKESVPVDVYERHVAFLENVMYDNQPDNLAQGSLVLMEPYAHKYEEYAEIVCEEFKDARNFVAELTDQLERKKYEAEQYLEDFTRAQNSIYEVRKLLNMLKRGLNDDDWDEDSQDPTGARKEVISFTTEYIKSILEELEDW